ncbi:hypothetical protein AK812_SmicGene41204 [Symbiodinium microadriaticum]|uniref:Uncharacterized protein n=1 Tax=Symbiodinium microadriaticum TaxID=2951 RepID=A0A1Q9C6P2_SYMMI|nr:hypothetical protein AK812_SmicGene41204 [Symbiodinium microadriaticum]
MGGKFVPFVGPQPVKEAKHEELQARTKEMKRRLEWQAEVEKIHLPDASVFVEGVDRYRLSYFDVQQRLFAISRANSPSSVLLRPTWWKPLPEHSTVGLPINVANMQQEPVRSDSLRLSTRFLQHFSTAAMWEKGYLYLQNGTTSLSSSMPPATSMTLTLPAEDHGCVASVGE